MPLDVLLKTADVGTVRGSVISHLPAMTSAWHINPGTDILTSIVIYNDALLPGNYKEAYEKMFGMLEDSGWQLKMETDGEPDMLDPDLVMPPAEAYSQGY